MRDLSNDIFFNLPKNLKISNPQGVIKKVYIGISQKSLSILSFQIKVWVEFIQNPFLNLAGLMWSLEPLKTSHDVINFEFFIYLMMF